MPSRPLGRILHVLDMFEFEVVQLCGISRCEHPKEREHVLKLVPFWHIEANCLVRPHPRRELLVVVPAIVPVGQENGYIRCLSVWDPRVQCARFRHITQSWRDAAHGNVEVCPCHDRTVDLLKLRHKVPAATCPRGLRSVTVITGSFMSPCGTKLSVRL